KLSPGESGVRAGPSPPESAVTAPVRSRPVAAMVPITNKGSAKKGGLLFIGHHSGQVGHGFRTCSDCRGGGSMWGDFIQFAWTVADAAIAPRVRSESEARHRGIVEQG